jgi:signal peptidase I
MNLSEAAEIGKRMTGRIRRYAGSGDFYQTLGLLALLLILRSSVFGNYLVPTGSMNPTIMEGDRIFANKLAYGLKLPFTKSHQLAWSAPARGDIIAFVPPHDPETEYTKRVIGLPGDTVTIDNHELFINGQKVPQRFLSEKDGMSLFEEDLSGRRHVIQLAPRRASGLKKFTVKVPAGHYFVMGDNRDNSFDSRFWGTVPSGNIDARLGFRWIHVEPGSYIPSPEIPRFIR